MVKAHHKKKLTTNQVDAIIRDYIDGVPIPRLARQYGVAYQTVKRVVSGFQGSGK